MYNISYTHDLQNQVSVGVTNFEGQLYIAASFCNDGYSVSGNYNKSRKDQFSRPMARKIIESRLTAAIQSNSETRFVVSFETNMSHNHLMKLFRKQYYALRDCGGYRSSIPAEIFKSGGVPTWDKVIWEQIKEIAQEIIYQLDHFKNMIQKNISREEISKWLLNDDHYNAVVGYICQNKELLNYLSAERLSQLFETDKKIKEYIVRNSDKFICMVPQK